MLDNLLKTRLMPSPSSPVPTPTLKMIILTLTTGYYLQSIPILSAGLTLCLILTVKTISSSISSLSSLRLISPRPIVTYKVSNLIIYPIKSCSGVVVESITLNEQGLKHDRKFVVCKEIEKDGGGGERGLEVVTMRDKPIMCKIQTWIAEEELTLGWGGVRKLTVKWDDPDEDGKVEKVECFRAYLHVEDVGDEAGDLLTSFLNVGSKRKKGDGERYRLCRVVRGGVNNGIEGEGDRKWGECYERGEMSGAVDGSKVLICFQESLRGLNERLKGRGGDLGMDNFRPNVVLEGGGEWDEDTLEGGGGGGGVMEGRKLCHRCVMCAVDQGLEEPKFRKR